MDKKNFKRQSLKLEGITLILHRPKYITVSSDYQFHDFTLLG